MFHLVSPTFVAVRALGLEELALAKSAEAWWMEPARRKMPANVPGLIYERAYQEALLGLALMFGFVV